MQRILRSFLLLSGLLIATGAAQGDFVTLNAIQDNTIYQTIDATNQMSNGAGNRIVVGQGGSSNNIAHRGLIEFDLSTIPQGSIINTVTVTLRAEKAPNKSATTITLQRLTVGWGEGSSANNVNTGQGAPSSTSPPDASWFFNQFNTSQWTKAGGDFNATPSASQTVPGSTGLPGDVTWGSTAGLVADVQGWVNNSSTNFGWLLLGDESTSSTTRDFDSREAGVAIGPRLSIDFTAPAPVPEPASLAMLAVAATGFAGYTWRRWRTAARAD
ncbi:hypothetical protein AYO44_10785 [Planctomycetaceae bacterium SCGC AG-212-F19]|nr:hypothetical protein AYO44_10785 [Planctomycetaceae bacterium SCGC AG-212-F19]